MGFYGKGRGGGSEEGRGERGSWEDRIGEEEVMRGKTGERMPCKGNALVEFLHDFPVRGVVWAVEDYDCEFLCDKRGSRC